MKLRQKNKINTLHFDSIDSTSTYIKKNIDKLSNLTFVDSLYQTNGHGRMQRNWESEKGKNLMFSFLIKDQSLIDSFSSLSIGCSVAILKALKKFHLNDLSIKWPNDVYAHGKKICGILLESNSFDNKITALIIGIGINVNTASFNEELINKATSYYLLKNKELDLDKLKKEVYKQIIKILNQIKKGNYHYLKIANKNNFLYQKEMYADINSKIQKVKVLRINKDNSLQIIINDQIKNINYGELTFHINN